jgi:opacity protein-like surface antigen
MKTFVRFTTLVVVLAIGGFSAYAQEMAVGGNIGVYADKGTSNLGIGAKFRYTLPKMSFGTLRGEGSFTYFNGYSGFWNISANAHYLINIPAAPKLTLYPLAGLAIDRYKGSGRVFSGIDNYTDPETGEIVSENIYSKSYPPQTEFGFNIGGGADYKITDRISINTEAKVRFDSGSFRYLFISTGIVYKF